MLYYGLLCFMLEPDRKKNASVHIQNSMYLDVFNVTTFFHSAIRVQRWKMNFKRPYYDSLVSSAAATILYISKLKPFPIDLRLPQTYIVHQISERKTL